MRVHVPRYPTLHTLPLDPRQTHKPPLPCSRSPSESSQHLLHEWGRHCRGRCSTQTQEVRSIERHQGTSRQHPSALALAYRLLCDPVQLPTISLQSQDLSTGRAPLPIL
ncbi:hypothetical protein FOCG_02354 [Fusarium oxysporum f. sp. radicis-lycopersici 26381]|nr:hypothetical protein FOWG_00555 [Fusarium oxysporum f. sp. lycopersici MN25]EXL58947.1 hypothetical protein FOCG_02354 [Fusarium oxysporum f. sp. radicis-lycopersici 26381]